MGKDWNSSVPDKKGKQGFASMPKEKQRKIASMGGKRAHELGLAHEWDSESAIEAGRKGGIEAQRRKRAAIEAQQDQL